MVEADALTLVVKVYDGAYELKVMLGVAVSEKLGGANDTLLFSEKDGAKLERGLGL